MCSIYFIHSNKIFISAQLSAILTELFCYNYLILLNIKEKYLQVVNGIQD